MSRLPPHLYTPDATAAPTHRGDQPCTCGLPRVNTVHALPDAPADVPADVPEQAEHRRRIGDDT